VEEYALRRCVGSVTLFLSAVALAVLGSAAASHGATSPVKESFRYCSDPTFPPMESTTTAGTPIGFDVDMAEAIGKLWKVKASFVQTAFPGLLPGLASKRCNMVISAIFVTPDRVKRFPAVGYMKTHRALVVQAGNPKRIKGPNDLSGKVVAVQAGTKYEEYLQALNDRFKSAGRARFTLQSYPGDTDAVAQLLIGRADAVLTQDTSGAFHKKRHPGRLSIAHLFPETDTFGIYYRRSEHALGKALRAAIATLKRNGTLTRIAAEHELPVADVK
jgi:polar amino acid transport system substrate-binding protein